MKKRVNTIFVFICIVDIIVSLIRKRLIVRTLHFI